MPAFILAFGFAFSFFMYVIPANVGLFPKMIISVGMAAAGNVVFLMIAPDLAMMKLGGS